MTKHKSQLSIVRFNSSNRGVTVKMTNCSVNSINWSYSKQKWFSIYQTCFFARLSCAFVDFNDWQMQHKLNEITQLSTWINKSIAVSIFDSRVYIFFIQTVNCVITVNYGNKNSQSFRPYTIPKNVIELCFDR